MCIDDNPAMACAKRAALYLRISPHDQNQQDQIQELRQIAAQRGFEIVAEFTDRTYGKKGKRPGLDQLLADVRRGRFKVVLTYSCDRIARSTHHFLEVLSVLNKLDVQFCSLREGIDTGGPLGAGFAILISAIAELERNLIGERVRAGMRHARLDGQHIGRQPLQRDRQQGHSIRVIAKEHGISTATVQRVLRKCAVDFPSESV
jgi:DNA invertase Pin-like site-specific DNA recombinase